MLENKCRTCGRDLDSGFNCPVCSKKTIETELKVKLEDIVLLAESTAKLAQEVYALHLKIVNGNENKRS